MEVLSYSTETACGDIRTRIIIWVLINIVLLAYYLLTTLFVIFGFFLELTVETTKIRELQVVKKGKENEK